MTSKLKQLFFHTSMAEKTDAEKDNMRRNESSVIELHFEMFKQFAWLSSATIGAIVFLIQLNVLDIGTPLYKAIGAFAMSILLSIYGQLSLVSNLSMGKSVYDIRKGMIAYTVIILFIFGLGIGFAMPK